MSNKPLVQQEKRCVCLKGRFFGLEKKFLMRGGGRVCVNYGLGVRDIAIDIFREFVDKRLVNGYLADAVYIVDKFIETTGYSLMVEIANIDVHNGFSTVTGGHQLNALLFVIIQW